MKSTISVVLGAVVLVGCASTTSTVISQSPSPPTAAVLPLEGPLGSQAADLLSAQFAENGVVTVERAKVIPLINIDAGLSSAQPKTVESFSRFGDGLGVHYLFVGTVSAVGGPLYSYAHVNMTLRLIDTRTQQTRWIGRYGNSMWSSAISTQGDLQRGARDLVREFVKSGGPELLRQ